MIRQLLKVWGMGAAIIAVVTVVRYIFGMNDKP